jgi:putative ABC transport system permease protein
MSFVINMARREIRASWRRVLLFFVCIAIGVASIVSLRSTVQTLKGSVSDVARAQFAGDVRVSFAEPLSREFRATLERCSESPLVEEHTETIETYTTIRAADNAMVRPAIVGISGIQENFPLYGEVRLSGGASYSPTLLENRGALVPSVLARRLNLHVGDAVKIGNLSFTIRGLVERLPGNELDFTAPQVAVNYDDVKAAGLTGFGSRVAHRWLFKTHDGRDQAVLDELTRGFRTTEAPIMVDSFRHAETWLRASLSNFEGFGSLVGLAILALGGIGVASVTRVFIQQKIQTVAILKCLGGRNREVLGAYLAQALAHGFIGSFVGLLLACVIIMIGGRYAAAYFPFDVQPGLTWNAAIQGVGIGILVTMLFSLPALLEIRVVKPLLLLRDTDLRRRGLNRFLTGSIDWAGLTARAVIGLALLGLAVWQSGSLSNARLLIGASVVTAIALNLTGLALIWSLRRLPRLPSFSLRHGVTSLYRPGNQTRVILFAVGLGALFMIAVRMSQANLQRDYALDLESLKMDMFLVDLQSDQRAAAEAMLARSGGSDLELIPLVRGRIVGLRRSPANPVSVPADELRRLLAGEREMTYRLNLDAEEYVVAGKFWEPTPAAEPEVSIAEYYSHSLGVTVGDTLIFDIGGRRLEARITSIRGENRQTNRRMSGRRFQIVFRPGALDAAPHTFVGGLKGPSDEVLRARLENEVAEQFPNVFLIDSRDVIEDIRERTSDMSFGVSVLGGVVVFCGVVILVGSIAMTKLYRLYESAILKTLGAKRRVIICVTLIEYSVLGLLAGAIGSIGAIGLTWAMSKANHSIPWRFDPWINVVGIFSTVLLVVVVGLLSCWDVVVRKPLGILRAE